jgi:hypothetical protein
MDAATFATAYALSTSAGIRPFLTLALASIAMHFGYLHPAHAFAFMGSDGATLLLGGLAIVEFVADKVPGVDHALHVLHFAVKPVTAAILVGGAMPDAGIAPFALMGVAALNALGVHTGIAAMRGASTSLSLGMANPIVSVLEDIASAFATVLAIALPFAGAAVAIAVSLIVFVIARAVLREFHSARACAITAG